MRADNPIFGFRLAASDFTRTGRNLSRPECVIAEPDGTLWASDNRAMVSRIGPDGSQAILGEMGPFPNGIAMERSGALLVANIETGQLFRMQRDGSKAVVLDSFEGRPLGSLNFPYLDDRGDLWMPISTRTVPRARSLAQPIGDGQLLRMDGHGRVECVGEGFFFANEVRVDRQRRFVYIAETMAGRISRAPLRRDGTVGAFRPFGPDPLFPGAHVDGIAFDAYGNLWVAEVFSNSIVVLTPEGEAVTVFQDPEGKVLNKPTSFAFGGPDLRTVYLGSLAMDHLCAFRSPVAGEPMHHWTT